MTIHKQPTAASFINNRNYWCCDVLFEVRHKIRAEHGFIWWGYGEDVLLLKYCPKCGKATGQLFADLERAQAQDKRLADIASGVASDKA